MDKVTKYFRGSLKSFDPATKRAEVVISDETVDRYKERVLVSSFKGAIKDFMKHPILLSSHSYRGLQSQIGEFKEIKVDEKNKEVVGVIEYYAGLGNKESDWAMVLAEKGVAAFSIGFIPKKYKTYNEEEREESNGSYRDYFDIELLETSQVLIPANPSALQKSIFCGDEEQDPILKEIAQNIADVLVADGKISLIDGIYKEVDDTKEVESEAKEVEDVIEKKEDNMAAMMGQMMDMMDSMMNKSDMMMGKSEEMVSMMKEMMKKMSKKDFSDPSQKADEMSAMMSKMDAMMGKMDTMMGMMSDMMKKKPKEVEEDEVTEKTETSSTESTETEVEAKEGEEEVIEDVLGEEKMTELKNFLFNGAEDVKNDEQEVIRVFEETMKELKEKFLVS